MKKLLLAIGFLLIIGGMLAVSNPKAGVMISSGPDAQSEYPKEVRDEYSKERSRKTGFVAIVLGVGLCAAAFFLKGLKTPEPHDTPA